MPWSTEQQSAHLKEKLKSGNQYVAFMLFLFKFLFSCFVFMQKYIDVLFFSSILYGFL